MSAKPEDAAHGRRHALSLLAGAAAWLVSGCGGGGAVQTSGVGSGGTGTYSSGTITDFGSVVVNGIHFDQQAARVTMEDGSASTPAALQLGMTVEIDASAVTTDGSGTRRAAASAIRFASELLGPVDSVGTTMLLVMGQQVDVVGTTRWGGGLSTLQDVMPGDVVEVYGRQDAGTGGFVATRIERRDPAGVAFYKVRGVVRDLNYGTMTCRIGSQVMAYMPTLEQFGVLVNGRVARALLQKLPPAAGRWAAQSVDVSQPLVADRDAAIVEGRVTELGASPLRFSLNGIVVDAQGMTSCPACAGLQLGAALRVTGRLQGGVLVASVVEALP